MNMSDKYLPSPYGKRELTEKQLALLDNLESCNYDPMLAAQQAGYAQPRAAVNSVKEELATIAQDLIGNASLRAASTLVNIMNSEAPIPNIKEKMAAANSLLDRAGFVKKEVMDINHKVQGGVFVLPEKKPPTVVQDAEFTEVQDED